MTVATKKTPFGMSIMRKIEGEAIAAAMPEGQEPAPAPRPQGKTLEWVEAYPDTDFRPVSNVVSGLRHEVAVGASLETIAAVIGRTMGPHGSNAMLREASGEHTATKDGYSVLRRMNFVQEIPSMVLDIVKTLSRRLVVEVGDGSSTAAIAADGLYRTIMLGGKRPACPGRRLAEVIAACGEAVAEAVERKGLETRASVGNIEQLARVATVATNNDPAAGRFIAEVYERFGKDANITVTVSGTKEDRSVPNSGYRLPRGFIDPVFANESDAENDSKVCRLDKAAVILWRGAMKMSNFGPFGDTINQCFARGLAVVFVANEFSPEVQTLLVQNKVEGKAPFLAVDHSSNRRNGDAILEDLAIALGTTVFSEDNPPVPGQPPELGMADSVVSKATETVLFRAIRPPAVADRIAEIEGKIAAFESVNAEGNIAIIDDLRARRRALAGNEVSLYVGGESEAEKRTKTYLYEDAVLACQAAIRTGIVEGGGMAVVRTIRDNWDPLVLRSIALLKGKLDISDEPAQLELVEYCLSCIGTAFINVQRVVLENANHPDYEQVVQKCVDANLFYDANSGAYFPADELRIPAPAATDISVLRTACSIVGVLISSNQTVLGRLDMGAL